jgi:hypothetical protein
VSEQQPWDAFRQQDPRQYQDQPWYPPQQQPNGQQAYPPERPPYRQQWAPNEYQGQPPYPQQPYDQRPVPQGASPYGQQTYPPHGHRQQPNQAPPGRRRRRRVFLWVFLVIQALFVIWIITAVATVHTGATQAQLAQGCYDHNWYPLFRSQADCVQHYGGALNDAGTAGKAIGVGLVIVFWMVVDVILGVSYGVYRLATRSRNG